MSKCKFANFLMIVIAVALMLACLISCGKTEPKEISCEDIIKAYDNAGYTVKYHNHSITNTESDIICSIQIDDPSNPPKNYLYIDRYANIESAKMAVKDTSYNPVLWFVFAINGETRWLKSEQYGVIHYHTYSNKITKPLENLMK